MLDPDEATTDEGSDGTLAGHAGPPPVQRFRHTPVGMVLAAGMLGLRDAFESRKDDEPAIVEDWSGGEPFSDPYVLRLDPDDPRDSIVMVRPWLRKPPGAGG